jgi:streptomycin 6-kinase
MEVPDRVRRTIAAWFGNEGRRWCEAASGTASRLSEQWKLRPEAILPGATHAPVVACTRADGTPAVLKLPFVDEENRAEADALGLYDGDGAVRLLDHDPASGALLLERLVPGTPLPDRFPCFPRLPTRVGNT